MKAMLLAAPLFVASILGITNEAFANSTVTLSERIVEIPVDISTTKVKLSRSDYESPVVKVLVPALADVTILDHRNTGEAAPCLATYETFSPADVVQGNPSVERVSFTIKLVKQTILDQEKKSCLVSLSEVIDGKIRGFTFIHQKYLDIGERHPDDCR